MLICRWRAGFGFSVCNMIYQQWSSHSIVCCVKNCCKSTALFFVTSVRSWSWVLTKLARRFILSALLLIAQSKPAKIPLSACRTLRLALSSAAAEHLSRPPACGWPNPPRFTAFKEDVVLNSRPELATLAAGTDHITSGCMIPARSSSITTPSAFFPNLAPGIIPASLARFMHFFGVQFEPASGQA